MGIKNLRSLIEKYALDSITKKHLETYKNKIITIDTSLYMYRIKYSNNNNFIDGFIKQIMRLLRNRITPVYIFDGAPPAEKETVLQIRRDKITTLHGRINEVEKLIENAIINPEILNDIGKIKVKEINKTGAFTERKCTIKDLEEEYQKLNKRNINVSKTDFKDLKTLFKLMGIPYIESNGEAETLCAKLCRCNMVEGCMSEDMDILPNGGRKFLRKFNCNNNFIVEYNLDIILEKMNFSYEQFIDVCILCGCDYCPKITGIGPINAYKLIKKYSNIETILENLSKKNKVPKNFNYQKARDLFICEYDNIQCLEDQMKLYNPNIEELNNYMEHFKVSDKTKNLVNASLIYFYHKIKDKSN